MVRFSHVGQCVRDLEATRAFYVEVLGFEEVMDLDVSGSQSATLLRLPDPVGLRAVYLKRDGFVLELLAFSAARAAAAPGAADHRARAHPHLGRGRRPRRDVRGGARARGTVLTESRLPTAVFVADPDGQMVELLAGDQFAQRLHG